MMADLMDQHMPDQIAERFVALGPDIEDWAAIKMNHVRKRTGLAAFPLREAVSAKQAEQFEFRFGVEFDTMYDTMIQKLWQGTSLCDASPRNPAISSSEKVP